MYVCTIVYKRYKNYNFGYSILCIIDISYYIRTCGSYHCVSMYALSIALYFIGLHVIRLDCIGLYVNVLYVSCCVYMNAFD